MKYSQKRAVVMLTIQKRFLLYQHDSCPRFTDIDLFIMEEIAVFPLNSVSKSKTD